MTLNIHTLLSNLNSNAKPIINIMAVDFDIVYNETVMNSKLQLERPISIAAATPVGAS